MDFHHFSILRHLLVLMITMSVGECEESLVTVLDEHRYMISSKR